MGRGSRRARAEGDVERVARAARATTTSSATCAAASSIATRRSCIVDRRGRSARRSVRRGARGGARLVHDRLAATYFWPCQSHASLGAVLRGRRRPRRRRDHLDLVAGHPRPARDPRARLRTRAARRCASSSSRARVRTARTAPTTRRPMPCCCRRRSGSRCACSGRVRTSTAGIRRARSSCSTCAPASTPRDGSSRGTRRCGFRPTAAARGSCSRRSPPGIAAGQRPRRRRGVRERRSGVRRRHVRVLAHWMRDTPLNPSNLRAPGKPANVFAVESFTDEIAAALRVDPLAFRTSPPDRSARARGAGARVEGVRLAAAAVAESGRPGKAASWSGRGVAYTRYKQAENYVAHRSWRSPSIRRAAASSCGASSARTTAAWS